MPILTHDQIDDFVSLTLKKFMRHKWTDLSLEHQEYCSAAIFDKNRVIESGGEQISFRLKTKNTGTARYTGLFAQDVTAVEDVMVEATVPWVKATTNYSYDVDEPDFQSDRETIINILKVREHDAKSNMAELHEEGLWSQPSSSTDSVPRGIPYWIVKDATTTPAGAFNGGDPTAGAAAGVSSTTYPRWRNWTFGYSTVSSDNLVARLKKAIAFTRFMAPVPHPELGYGKARQVIYTTYTVQEQLERLAETRNDRLGSDVARYVNQVTVAGIPIKWVPYLNANDLTDPLYGVDWGVMRPFVKKGCWMRRTGPKPAARQHTVREVHFDSWYNYCCYNRRNLFVGSTS